MIIFVYEETTPLYAGGLPYDRYAYALAAFLHNARRRYVRRDGFIFDFLQLRKEQQQQAPKGENLFFLKVSAVRCLDQSTTHFSGN